MSKGQTENTIELNGKLYDAATGAAVQEKEQTPAPAAGKTAPSLADMIKNLPAEPAHHSNRQRISHRIAAKSAVRHLEHSKTLMRSAVKKPAPGLKRHLKVQSSTDAALTAPSLTVAAKPSVHRVDVSRAQRAGRVPRSQAVQRFRKTELTNYSVPVTVRTTAQSPAALQPVQQLQPADPQPSQPTEDFLERAIQQATSHLEPAPMVKKRRLFWPFSA